MYQSLLKFIRKILLITFTLFLVHLQGLAQELTIASYNIRNVNKGDSLKGNGWSDRAPVIAQLVQFHDFDIFGTQEGVLQQLIDLKTLAPNYDYIGIGRGERPDKGEFSAIFYKTAVFKLLDKGDFWLSEETTYSNKGWDAALPRICSWGHFEHIETGKTFYFFNAHFDHRGIEARKQSSKLILEQIKTIAGNQPTILSGDFNVDQYNESYHLLANSTHLKDAYELSPIKYALNGTFNAFNPNSKRDDRIDHIFLSDDFKVNRYGILTDTYRSIVVGEESVESSKAKTKQMKSEARLPSDHFPVMIKVNMK